MAIVKEEPGIWVAYCDHKGCDTRLELDTDPDDEFLVAARELSEEHEWRRFQKDGEWQNWCTDHDDEFPL